MKKTLGHFILTAVSLIFVSCATTVKFKREHPPLLLEVNNQFIDALALLEELDEKISKNGINSPPFIKTEMKKMKSLVDELIILEEYKD